MISSSEVSSVRAFGILKNDKNAALIDVRTQNEWLDGIPDLTSLEKDVICISWILDDGAMNNNFIEDIESKILCKSDVLFFICRSGIRSRDASSTARNAGYGNSYNVEDGFYGYNSSNGWMHCKLPYKNWKENE